MAKMVIMLWPSLSGCVELANFTAVKIERYGQQYERLTSLYCIYFMAMK